jgi:hypothetical protein
MLSIEIFDVNMTKLIFKRTRRNEKIEQQFNSQTIYISEGRIFSNRLVEGDFVSLANLIDFI